MSTTNLADLTGLSSTNALNIQPINSRGNQIQNITYQAQETNSLSIQQFSQNSKSNKHIQFLIQASKKLIQQQNYEKSINLLDTAQLRINQFQKDEKSWKNRSLNPQQILFSTPRNDSKQLQKFLLEIYFLKATCLTAKKQYKKSLEYLLEIKKLCPQYQENIIFLTSIAYFNLNQFQKSLNSLNEDPRLTEDPDRQFFLAKIHRKLNKLQLSQKILSKLLEKFSNHFPSIKIQLQSLISLKQYSSALQLVSKVIISISDPNDLKYLKKKLIDLEYLNKNYSNCLLNIEKLQSQYPLDTKDSKISYIKGKILSKFHKNYRTAEIHFNQSVTINSNTHFAKLSLSQLIIHCLKQRDFYEALTYCKRINFISFQDTQLIQNLYFLAEGLTLLMKRNFEEALKIIKSIKLETFKNIYEPEYAHILLNLYHNSVGFGLFNLRCHKQALESYSKIQINSQQEAQYLPCLYNKKLCEGLIHILYSQNQQKSIECFEQSIDYLIRPEPYFYISVILTQKNIKNGRSTEIFMKILTILESGLNINGTAQMHFYRAMIYVYLGMNAEALDDIDKAIEISEDNIVDHFYLKGIVFFVQGNYEQAIAQLDVALSIDEKSPKVLLEKAKCELTNGNLQSADQDLQAYRNICSLEQDPQIWELLFLLHERKFEQILQLDLKMYQSLSNPQMQQCIEDLKNKCNFFLARFEEAGPCGKLVLALIYEKYDDLLKLLDQAIDLKVDVGPITEIDLKFIKSYVLVQMKKYQQALLTYEQIENFLVYNEITKSNQEIEFKILLLKINTILIHLSDGNYTVCMSKIQALIQSIHEGDVLDELRQFQNKVQQLINPASQNIQQGTSNQTEEYTFSLFQDRQMLSSFLPLKNYLGISYRLLIPFPILIIEQILPDNQKILESFSFEKIQNKPQAPWIKRGEFGVIFTNEIRQYNNLHINTEQQSEINHQRQITQQSKKKFLQDLQLGSEVLLKLQKLTTDKFQQ